MSSKTHFVADRFTRALRMNSRETPSGKSKNDPFARQSSGATDSTDKPGVSGDKPVDQNTERAYFQAQQKEALGSSLEQSPASGFGPSQGTNNNPQTIPERPTAEDGQSLSSEIKDLDLQGRPALSNSNKRAFADPAHGQDPETGPRPTKFRTASLDDSYGRGSTYHQSRPAYYDAARDKSSSVAVSPPLQASAPQDSSNTRPHPDGYATTRPPQRNAGFIPATKVPHLFPDNQDDSSPSANPETERFTSNSPDTVPVFNTPSDHGSSMLLQPETRPITQEQLVNEVKGIYAGLVMVEKKCVEIDQQQSSTTNKLSNEQWQALIALHRTLLHEHHDFFLASQHPSSSPALRRLATKYAMPARMWRHGIHSFLELLRHRLPDSLDHMLAFVYLAYSMMALLMESVPSFEETWIECLGDLARYRMAIEEADLRDREVWSGVARMWYNKAADKSPNVGRIQHHLAVLARPNIVQQLFYYSKALVSVIPFQNARESIMLLFNPFLEGSEIASQRYPLVESAFVKANGVLFIHGLISEYTSLMEQFDAILDNHIGRVTAKFRVQGPEIASSLCAATFDFGNAKAYLTECFREQEGLKKAQLLAHQSSDGQEEPTLEEDPRAKRATMRAYWASPDRTSEAIRAKPQPVKDSNPSGATFSGSDDAAAFACHSLGEATTIVAQRIGDKNILPYMHVILAYLYGLAFVPNALIYVEGHVPWENITVFLNTLGRSGVVEARFEGADFPQQMSGTGRQLPEDFAMRGLIWAQHYFPADFFDGQVVDEDERALELPSHAAPRAERCLWLGVQLASLDRWIRYDSQTKQFSVTHFAGLLESMHTHTLDSRSQTLSAEPDFDSDMIDVEQ